MADQLEKDLDRLIKKVDQHEQTIAQLLVIIAETNRRISEFTSEQEGDRKQIVTFLS